MVPLVNNGSSGFFIRLEEYLTSLGWARLLLWSSLSGKQAIHTLWVVIWMHFVCFEDSVTIIFFTNLFLLIWMDIIS